MRRRFHRYLDRLKKLYRVNQAWRLGREERLRARDVPPEFWHNFTDNVLEQAEPTFVLSTGRCGTKLLTEAFETLPGVICQHTPTPELLYESRLAYEAGEQGKEMRRSAIRGARFELIAEAYLRERRYLETNNRVTFFAGELAEIFPRSRFVHVVRHPVDFVRSGARRDYYRGCYGDIGRIRPTSGEWLTAWDTLGDIGRIGWLWNETNAFIENVKRSLPAERCLMVKAEELFRDPEVLLGIGEHAGLTTLPDRGRVLSLLSQPVNPSVEPEEIAAFETWSEEEKQTLRRVAPLAENYDYAL